MKGEGPASQPSAAAKRRILGSPFKSPEHVSNNASQNLFPAKSRANGSSSYADALSPTPNRKRNKNKGLQIDEPIQEEDSDSALDTLAPGEDGEVLSASPPRTQDKQPIESTTPVNSEITCPICTEKMITLSQLNQHIDDVHFVENEDGVHPGESLKKTSSSSFDLPKLINSEFIGKDIKKWFTVGRGVNDASTEQSQQQSQQPSSTHATSPSRKTINLDLLDDNKGFSLRDSNASTDELDNQNNAINTTNNNISHASKANTSRISRAHWKSPSSSSTNRCSYHNCGKILNVKNGIVNCRRCGELFCNKHTYYKVRLRNANDGALPNYEPTRDGVWSRCCKECYLDKPDLRNGTSAGSNDLSDEFFKKRQSNLDERQMTRGRLQKKFIKLVNLMAENYLYHASNHNNNRFNLLSIFNAWDPEGDGPFTKQHILNEQKSIVGEDHWGHDGTATHCTICFTRFNLLIRKHHCRLCGQIVCDDSFGERKHCSIVVPLSKLIEKQSNLNYSLQVRSNWQQLVNIDSQDANVGQFSVRCCKPCKDEVLYEWRLDHLRSGNAANDDVQKQIFQKYDEMLLMKSNLIKILPRYRQLINSDDPNDHDEINRLRIKAMHCLKDYEDAIGRFKRQFFGHDDSEGKLVVKNSFEEYAHLINNITNSSLIYLQERLLEYKELNESFQQRENRILANDKRKEQEKLAGKLLSPPPLDDSSGSPTPTPVAMSPTPFETEAARPAPSLTKKQIRELREQLMVMKEQKFMIGNMINDTKKQRRFDELDPLIGNEKELDHTIESLEAQLGDFGF